MKSIFMLILGLILGYFLGAYSFFSFTVNFGSDKISQILLDSAQNVYSGSLSITGATTNVSKSVNDIINKQKQELVTQITEKQEQLKADIKDQLVNYLTSQINQLFGKM